MSISHEIRRRLWGDYDPCASFPYEEVKPDLQGWQSQHPFLADSVVQSPSGVIVEVGVWKGGSCVEMARAIKAHQLDSAIIAVDTWLGSAEHWQDDHWRQELGFEFGYPTLYRTFLANLFIAGVQDIVTPLPLDSANAWEVLRHLDIRPTLVHIDGAHDENSAWNDVHRWWEALLPGGTMIVDDYDLDGNCWPGPFAAVNRLLSSAQVIGFEAASLKCRFVKPLAS